MGEEKWVSGWWKKAKTHTPIISGQTGGIWENSKKIRERELLKKESEKKISEKMFFLKILGLKKFGKT